MPTLRQIALDDRGLDYVRESLQGVNAFCSELLEVVDQVPGDTFTFAPLSVMGERVYRFTEPGLPAEELAELRAERIMQLLDADADAGCVVDDVDAVWGDPELEDSPTAFGVGEEVYHWLTADDGFETVLGVTEEASSVWHGVAAVCTPPSSEQGGQPSALEALLACARSAVEISCLAYDGEGFVVWRRR
ncbi:MAG TPA: hypothetical protein VHY34_04955 [Caulobacteraceae bacterium]|jgi:hypothetical protein|nr:hypothetical protein [Caulobacteraceae bacterium]